jgi:hypothetical protein
MGQEHGRQRQARATCSRRAAAVAATKVQPAYVHACAQQSSWECDVTVSSSMHIDDDEELPHMEGGDDDDAASITAAAAAAASGWQSIPNKHTHTRIVVCVISVL